MGDHDPMSDDLDLHGLSPAQAREYTAQFVANMKELEKKRGELKQQFETWEQRVRLAKQHGKDDLVQQAMQRLKDISERHRELGREKRDLEVKVTLLKQRLRELERQPRLSINANALLEQLEQVVGSEHHLKESISRVEADDKLEELRRKMNEQSREE